MKMKRLRANKYFELRDIYIHMILFLAFAFMRFSHFFAVAFFISTILRISIGGFKVKGYAMTLALTSLYYMSLLSLYVLGIDNKVLVLSLVEVCIIIQIFIVPISSFHNKELFDLDKKVIRIRSAILSIIIAGIHIVLDNSYTLIAMWAIILQTTFILIYNIINIMRTRFVRL